MYLEKIFKNAKEIINKSDDEAILNYFTALHAIIFIEKACDKMICKNCKYYNGSSCEKLGIETDKNFGCNKFEEK